MKGRLQDRYVVGVEIGGLGVEVRSRNEYLAEQLRTRYQDYQPVSAERFLAEVEIISGRQNTSLLQQDLHFRQGVLVYHAPGCQGYVDPFHKQGLLQMDTDHPLQEVEYYLRVVIALLAFENGGVLFHSAGVVRNGRAYIFFGYSGSGKSTLARLSHRDEVLNDDLLVIMPEMDSWRVYATPFWNQSQRHIAVPHAPLAGLFRLVQDRKVYLEGMESAQGVAEMVSSCPVVSADPSRSQLLMERCQKILDAAPAYRLHFLPDDSFWRVIDAAV